MEEEIDLRPYIEALIKNWKWLVGVPIVMAILAFAISTFAISSAYSATAIVAVVTSKDTIELGDGIVEVKGNQPLSAFPDLALSDEVLNNLLIKLSLQDSISISKFREKLEAESGKDTSLVILTTTFEDPEMAAEVANAWADEFVSWANRLYVGQSEERILFFEDQLITAEQELALAETALQEFQAINKSKIISNTLTVYQQQHSDLLLQQSDTKHLLENTHALRDQLSNQAATVEVSYADQLTFLQLQLQAFNNDLALPIFLQADSQEPLTTKNRNDHIEIIDGLIHTLENKVIQIETNLTELEPQILTLQQDKQIALTELKRLNQDLAKAQQTYTALSFQVAENKIASQDSSRGFQLASRAVIPAESVDRGRLTILIVVIFLGIILSTFVILVVKWWRMK